MFLRLALLATAVLAVSAQTDPYEQFLDGLLGQLAPQLNASVKKCLTASNTGYVDTRKAILLIDAGISSGNVTKIYQGFQSLTTALVDIRNAAAACNAPQLAADLDTLIRLLLNDPLGVIDKLAPYYATVIADLQDSVVQWNAGNYTGSGADIGAVMVILISKSITKRMATSAKTLSVAVTAAPLPPAQQPPYVQFLNGILSILAPTVNGSVQDCLQDSDAGLIAVTRGFQLLSIGLQTANFTAIWTGVQFLETALEDLQAAAVKCNVPALADDLEMLIQQLLTDPLGVIDKLWNHWTDVLADLTTAISAWQSGNYNQAGVSLGKVLVILLTPTQLVIRRSVLVQMSRRHV
jgi:hypothetical protein